MYKNYLIYRQREKRLHLKDKQYAFSLQKIGDFALIRHYREANSGGKITRSKTH